LDLVIVPRCDWIYRARSAANTFDCPEDRQNDFGATRLQWDPTFDFYGLMKLLLLCRGKESHALSPELFCSRAESSL